MAPDIQCRDVVAHETCTHAGWRQVQPHDVGLSHIDAARRAADQASRQLQLDIVRLLFFEPAPRTVVRYDRRDPLVHLCVGFYDPEMKGKACPPDIVKPLTVWIRSGGSAPATAFLTAHEVRHLWQMLHADAAGGYEDLEADANEYAGTIVLRLGFDREDLAAMLDELGFKT